MTLDEVADELYALPRDEFTPTRDARAKQARSDGDRALAAAIGKLRRPTAAAWLVNQLVRARPSELARLAELGSALRTAHRELDGAALRSLSGRRHELVAALVAECRELGRGEGQVSDTVSRELEEMFAVALADERAEVALAAGRLTSTRDLTEAQDAGWPAADPAARPRPAPAPAPAAPAPEPAAPEPPAPAPAAPERAAPAPARPSRPDPAIARARSELERRAAALATAHEAGERTRRARDVAIEAEAAAHRAVADRRAELAAAEEHQQRTRRAAREARRAHDDAERALREARRHRDLAAQRLAALTGNGRDNPDPNG